MCEAYAADGTGLGRRVHHREDSDQRRLDLPQPRRGLGARLSRTSWPISSPATRDNRPPLSDGELGRDCVEVIYAAYLAAERGARVTLPFNAS